MMALFREPLLHFLFLGAAIFALFAVLDDRPAPMPADRLEVTEADADRLARQFEATWRRPPTADELAGLVDRFVREEVLVREALALGLDRGDAVVRQRLAQKMTFLLESAVESIVPTEAELSAHLAAHPDRFRRSGLVAFEQVPVGDGPTRAVLADLRAGVLPSRIGGPSLLPAQVPPSPRSVVDGTFGTGFYAAVAALPEGEWAGPVESGYGRHLVRLREAVPARVPALDEIREAVTRDWRATRRAELLEERLDALMAGYAIVRPDAGAAE
jgi:hypothetical protein